MTRIVKQICGFRFRFGGEAHSGWLPPGAATPLPTPIDDAILDLQIEFEGAGYLLIWQSRDGHHAGDLYFERMEDAMGQASEMFGVSDRLWRATSEESA